MQYIQKLLKLTLCALFFAMVCSVSPSEAAAGEFEIKASFGYDIFIYTDCCDDADDKQCSETESSPGAALSVELGYIVGDWFKILVDQDFNAYFKGIMGKSFLGVQLFGSWEDIEFGGKIGIGIAYGNSSVVPAVRVGINLGYVFDEDWTVGAAVNYTQIIKSDYYAAFNTQLYFTYRF